MIQVVNIKTFRTAAEAPGTIVYIGRKMPGRNGSVLANPFKLADYESREACLEAYTRRMRHFCDPFRYSNQFRLNLISAELDRLTEIAENGNLYLACWCAPEICHGDVIKAEIEKRLK